MAVPTMILAAMSWWWRHGPRVVLAAAGRVIALMFCFNRDLGGDSDSPRGDGRYRPVLARGDGHMMFLMARSIVFDRDLHFDNDLGRFGDPWGQPKTATGRKGIPHPLGPPLVWGGATVWLLYQGSVGWAIFMVLWGLFAISSIDNFVKPYLISRSSSLPILLIVFGVFGGIVAFGFIGIFIGPPVLAVGLTLVQLWTAQPDAPRGS